MSVRVTRSGSSMTLSRNKERKEELDNKTKIVTDWMQELLKEPVKGSSLKEKLLDGVVLCRVANAMKPGCIRKFHRSPKMNMMKSENIGFFLAACKTRFNVPQNTLFAPSDIMEAAEDGSDGAMLRVLTVLLMVIKEGGYVVAGLEGGIATFEEEGDEPQPDAGVEPTVDALISPRVDTTVVEQSSKALETPQQPTEIKKPEAVSKTTSTPETAVSGHSNEDVSVQDQVTSEILECINQELSIESKIRLIDEVSSHNNMIQERVLFASDADLRQLCFDMGLGATLNDVPQGNERKWYVDWILKFGRAK